MARLPDFTITRLERAAASIKSNSAEARAFVELHVQQRSTSPIRYTEEERERFGRCLGRALPPARNERRGQVKCSACDAIEQRCARKFVRSAAHTHWEHAALLVVCILLGESDTPQSYKSMYNVAAPHL